MALVVSLVHTRVDFLKPLTDTLRQRSLCSEEIIDELLLQRLGSDNVAGKVVGGFRLTTAACLIPSGEVVLYS